MPPAAMRVEPLDDDAFAQLVEGTLKLGLNFGSLTQKKKSQRQSFTVDVISDPN